jgi:Rhodopirellula transposase DDE domain
MPDFAVIKSKFESLRPVLDERLCRLWAAAEAKAIGRGGVVRVAAATGLSRRTIMAGLDELTLLEGAPGSQPTCGSTRRPRIERNQYRVRLPGAGRKRAEVKEPKLIPALEKLLIDEEAGDPMGEQKWVRSSLRSLSEKLAAAGYSASPGVVARLLKDLGFSLRTNKRKQGSHPVITSNSDPLGYHAHLSSSVPRRAE